MLYIDSLRCSQATAQQETCCAQISGCFIPWFCAARRGAKGLNTQQSSKLVKPVAAP